MARARLYLDEHIQAALAQGLKARGVDVLTTQEAGNSSLDDEGQLGFAAAQGRVLTSYTKRHFAKLHYDWMAAGQHHAGILLSDQLAAGIVLRRLMRLYFSLAREQMENRLEYLGAWK
jgi:hypothetical protein